MTMAMATYDTLKGNLEASGGELLRQSGSQKENCKCKDSLDDMAMSSMARDALSLTARKHEAYG